MQPLRHILGQNVVDNMGVSVGQVRDVYFDEDNWVVRYILVDLQEEPNRKALLYPANFQLLENEGGGYSVNMAIDRIRSSPQIDVNRPVLRQHEVELLSYYGWPLYWDAADVSNIEANLLAATPLVDMAADVQEQRAEELEPDEKTYLRSANEIFGYVVQARDGEVGEIYDFLVEQQQWKIQYLVVDTNTWLPGGKVVLSPSWVEEFRWAESRVVVDLKRETIEKSPPYQEDMLFDEDFETRLAQHYDRDLPR